MPFSLTKTDLQTIIATLKKHEEVESACIFGSRAKGNYKNGSDVDIALKGNKLSLEVISAILYELNEETPMPYHFDVLNFHAIENAGLLEHIQRVGKVFYEKGKR